MVILKLIRKIEKDMNGQTYKKQKVKPRPTYDINKDGVFDKKDAKLAGKTMAKWEKCRKWFVLNAVLRNMMVFYVWDVGIKQMNKKGQVAGLIVFIVLTLVDLVTIGMFESESGFMSDTINGFIDNSGSSSANLLVRLVIPVFFLVFFIGAFLTLRGATFG